MPDLIVIDGYDFLAIGAVAGCLLTLWLRHATGRNHS